LAISEFPPRRKFEFGHVGGRFAENPIVEISFRRAEKMLLMIPRPWPPVGASSIGAFARCEFRRAENRSRDIFRKLIAGVPTVGNF
jgi:hypothetical protein